MLCHPICNWLYLYTQAVARQDPPSYLILAVDRQNPPWYGGFWNFDYMVTHNMGTQTISTPRQMPAKALCHIDTQTLATAL